MAEPEPLTFPVPKSNSGGYIEFVAAFETLVHIPVVEFATPPMAVTPARKIRASISPYSTAVAALVDRISL
jgi:hypothetical protein